MLECWWRLATCGSLLADWGEDVREAFLGVVVDEEAALFEEADETGSRVLGFLFADPLGADDGGDGEGVEVGEGDVDGFEADGVGSILRAAVEVDEWLSSAVGEDLDFSPGDGSGARAEGFHDGLFGGEAGGEFGDAAATEGGFGGCVDAVDEATRVLLEDLADAVEFDHVDADGVCGHGGEVTALDAVVHPLRGFLDASRLLGGVGWLGRRAWLHRDAWPRGVGDLGSRRPRRMACLGGGQQAICARGEPDGRCASGAVAGWRRRRCFYVSRPPALNVCGAAPRYPAFRNSDLVIVPTSGEPRG